MAKRSWWFSQEGDNFDNVTKTNVESGKEIWVVLARR